jgi:hypothetical protein
MSGAAGPFTELLWAGPSVSYAAQAAASASAQFLFPGATGAFEQPFIPANWWQFGRRNQRARIDLAGVLNSTGGTATTAIWTVGLATAANTATPGTGGGALVATCPVTVTSFVANSGWRLTADIISRNVGYGVTSVSTSLLTDAEVKVTQPATAPTTVPTSGIGPPTLLSTIDAGLQWWVYATVTFSTAVATNSCQVTRADVWGLN